ncbi:unnamed protein product, partial [Mesorhabditis belari]|uniref:Uncharacterized protein n=1 Tax=Mesorhabditis belari TaxID=2138241 RepID=A0AAF3FL85_9BILA
MHPIARQFVINALQSLNKPKEKQPQFFIEIDRDDLENYVHNMGERYFLSTIMGNKPNFYLIFLAIILFLLCSAIVFYIIIYFFVNKRRLSIPRIHWGAPPTQTDEYMARQKTLEDALLAIQSWNTGKNSYKAAVMYLKSQWVIPRTSLLQMNFPQDFLSNVNAAPLTEQDAKERLQESFGLS